jgi:DNA-binding IclR family transcriptional regulator
MKSLNTALQVLREFMGNQADLGVGEIAEKLGLPKSQVSKILSTLRANGIVTQDPRTRRYSVGLAAFMLGSRFVNFHRLSREALPLMRQLVEKTGHSARLSMMDGDDVIYLLGFEGPLLLNTAWRAGTRMPLHSTAAGRVLLAFLPEARVDELLDRYGMPAFTAATVTDRDTLKRMLAEIRTSGYAQALSETTQGLGTIAAPILDENQEITGSLGIAFPVHVLSPQDVPRLVEALHDAARVLSHRMGSPVYPFGGRRGEDAGDAPPRPARTRRKAADG